MELRFWPILSRLSDRRSTLATCSSVSICCLSESLTLFCHENAHA